MSVLEGQVAIVTGGAHPEGIGHAIAQQFAQEGAEVFVLDLEASLSKNITSMICDITDAGGVNKVIESIAARGAINILVNNAGVARGSEFTELTDQDWHMSIDVNLLGTVNVCKAVIPYMGNGGRIINMASLAGLGAIDGIPACYTATKFAVVGLTKQLALELAPRGITCNALCPGSIKTQMHTTTLQQISKQFDVDIAGAQEIENEAIPMGASAEPMVVADAALYLASPAAGYVTGVPLPVAGGMSPGL